MALQLLFALTGCGGCQEPNPPPLLPEVPELTPAPMAQGLLENPQQLRRTFDRLRLLEKRQEGRVAILQLGASHTASMAFADETFKLLGTRFGELGPGFIPAAPMSARFLGAPPPPDSERGRIRIETEGPWEAETALYAHAGGVWSLAGSRLRGKKGASLRLDFGGAPCLPEAAADGGCDETPAPAGPGRLDLFYVEEPGAGRLSLWIDGEERVLPRARLASSGQSHVRVARLDVPEPPKSLALRVQGPGRATVHGFAYERLGAGLVYDVLGLSGSSAYVTDRYQRPSFVRQLRSREPSLYVLFYGTNESTFAELTSENYRKRYSSLLRTLRQAAPESDCLLLSNTDREVPRDGGYVPAPRSQIVEDTIRLVAYENGCAFWSTRRAMGGPGGIRDWVAREPPLALPDHTHLTELGYRTLAQMLVGDLLAAYDAAMLPEPR